MAPDDLEQIRQLKYAYLRHLDLKHWDDFTELFVEDATGAYAGLDFTSREDLVDYMRNNLPADLLTLHQVHHPEITVDGDHATARWYLHDKVFVPAYDVAIEGAAFYEDRLVRTEDGWRFAHVGYERTFESSWTMSAVPGWTFKRGAAYDAT